MSDSWWKEEQLEGYYEAWQCAVGRVEVLEAENTALKTSLSSAVKALKKIADNNWPEEVPMMKVYDLEPDEINNEGLVEWHCEVAQKALAEIPPVASTTKEKEPVK